MRNHWNTLGTVTARAVYAGLSDGIGQMNGTQPGNGLLTPSTESLIWTPDQGASGLIVVARPRSLLAVVGGRVLGVVRQEPDGPIRGRVHQVTLGGLIIPTNSRQKEPSRVIGHPDLASGASVQRGETLYVSVAEAIYRESRGEEVEIHLTPSGEDAEALSDLRTRARNRWDNDRLPDGWTRPLAAPVIPPFPKEKTLDDELPNDLRELAARIRGKEDDKAL